MHSLNIITYNVHIGKTKREAKEEKGSRKHGRRGIAVNIV